MTDTARRSRKIGAPFGAFIPPPFLDRRGWGGRLFTPAPPRAWTWRGVVVALAATVVATAIIVARQPGIGALDTVWAEDGTVFLSDAVNKSPFDALTTSYAGYYHAVPRLLAQLAAALPASAAAAALAVEAALCTAAVAALVYVASAGHLTSRLGRVLVAGIVVALPLGQDDLPNSIANLHWVGLYALFWMLIWTPAGRAGRIVAPVVVLLVAISDILVLAFLPLALLRLVTRRDRYSAVLAGLLAAGLALQVSGLLTGSSSRTLSPGPVRSLVGYVLRAVPAAMVGERWFGSRVDGRWLVLAAVAWSLVAAVLAVALVARATRPNLVLAAVAGAHSVLLYVLPVTLSGVATPRYAAAPALLLVTALVALLEPVHGRTAPLWIFATLLALVCLVNLRVDNSRAHGPSWADELAKGRHVCAVQGAGSVTTTIPPLETPAWTVPLPCRYITR